MTKFTCAVFSIMGMLVSLSAFASQKANPVECGVVKGMRTHQLPDGADETYVIFTDREVPAEPSFLFAPIIATSMAQGFSICIETAVDPINGFNVIRKIVKQ